MNKFKQSQKKKKEEEEEQNESSWKHCQFSISKLLDGGAMCVSTEYHTIESYGEKMLSKKLCTEYIARTCFAEVRTKIVNVEESFWMHFLSSLKSDKKNS